MARKRRRNLLQDRYRVRGKLREIILSELSCAYCDTVATTVDHVIPVSTYVRVLGDDGRVSVVDNLIPACKYHNDSRGNTDIRLYAGARLHEIIARFPRIRANILRLQAVTPNVQ